MLECLLALINTRLIQRGFPCHHHLIVCGIALVSIEISSLWIWTCVLYRCNGVEMMVTIMFRGKIVDRTSCMQLVHDTAKRHVGNIVNRSDWSSNYFF